MDKSINKKTKASISPIFSLSFAMSFMLFIFAPVELYFENKTEYWFDFRQLFPVCLLMFGAAFVLSILVMTVLRCINDRLYYLAVAAYLVVYICTYIQGNYFVGNLPPLDGSPVPWDIYDYQRKYSIILWIVVIFLIVLLWKAAHRDAVIKCAKYIPAGITAVLFITLTVVCISKDGLDKKLSIAVSTDYELEMSTDKNFVIMMFDMVDEGKMAEMFETHPEYKDLFKDFTCYDNTLGAYPHTAFAVPFILSGDWFECDELIDTYLKNAYKTSPFFAQLEDEGYRLGLYEPEAPLTDESMYRFENVKDVETKFTSIVDFIKVEMRLVGLKYAPYDLKRRCLVLPEEIPNLRQQINDIEYAKFTDSNLIFLNDLYQKGISLTDEKCFRFIHLEGAHTPFRYDKDLNIIEDGDYEQAVEASMTVMEAYIQALKDSGVYDNTVILVMADHGYNYHEIDPDTPENKQHPILFVKGFNEKHENMEISEAPISHEDYLTAYTRLLAGAGSSEIFDYGEGDYRERRYLFYYLWDRDHMDEYVQKGYAGDMETMELTGVKFSQ